MATKQEIQKQLQALVRQVRADSDRENEQRNQAQKAAEERGAARAEAARDQFLKIGLSENDLEADADTASERQRDIATLTQKLSQSASVHVKVRSRFGALPDDSSVISLHYHLSRCSTHTKSSSFTSFYSPLTEGPPWLSPCTATPRPWTAPP